MPAFSVEILVTSVNAPLTRFETETLRSRTSPELVTVPLKVIAPLSPIALMQNLVQAMLGLMIRTPRVWQALASDGTSVEALPAAATSKWIVLDSPELLQTKLKPVGKLVWNDRFRFISLDLMT